MRRLGTAFGTLMVVVAAAISGCGATTACQKAESDGHPTHACYLENQKAQRELRESEVELNRAGGVSKADEEQQTKREFREGWEEGEKEAEFWDERGG